MAILCRDLNLLFIMVPGTGCSVLGNLLVTEFGGEPLPERDVVRHGRVIHPAKHNSVAQLLRDGIVSPERLTDWTVVANVRNPYDRLVTYYQRLAGEWVDYSLGVQERSIERARGAISEEEFAQQREALRHRAARQKRRQRIMRRVGFNSWLLATLARKSFAPDGLSQFAFPMLEGVHYALRNEALGEAVQRLFVKLGVSCAVEIPRKNITQGKRPYTEYWNPLSRSAFGHLLAPDLQRFGYVFDDYDRSRPLLDLRSASPATAPPAARDATALKP